jgi:hypothetical protein
MLVALTHMRVPNDRVFAASAPDYDLVLGGHDHDYVVEEVPHTTGGGSTLLVKSGDRPPHSPQSHTPPCTPPKHTSAPARTHVRTHTHTRTETHTHRRTHRHTHTLMKMCACVSIHRHTLSHTHRHTHTREDVRTCVHTQTHTHKHLRWVIPTEWDDMM